MKLSLWEGRKRSGKIYGNKIIGNFRTLFSTINKTRQQQINEKRNLMNTIDQRT